MGQLDEANANLAAAEKRLQKVKAKVAELQSMFENQMAEKKRIEVSRAHALGHPQQAILMYQQERTTERVVE